MKPFNFKLWFKSPRFQKWGLFCLLAVSLGFNLSMNPEHFNNIARYEVGTPLQSYDLAQEQLGDPALRAAPAAAPAPVAAPAAAAPAPRSGKTQVITVYNGTDAYDAKVFEVEGLAFVSFKKLRSSTEAAVTTPGAQADCEICKIAAMPLTSSIDKIDDIKIELNAILNKKAGTAAAATTTAAANTCPMDVVPKAKSGELAEITSEQLDACATKCDKASDSMSCHKNRLVELSKFMKNSAAQASSIQSYFQKFLRTEIKAGFVAPTVREGPYQNCEGVVAYQTRFGVGCQDTSSLEKSQDLANQLIRELASNNGKSTIEDLTKLAGASFNAQTINAQAIGNRGMQTGNMDQWQYGMYFANPYNLEGMLNTKYGELLDSVYGRTDKNNQQSFADSLARNMYNPVSTYLGHMQKCGSGPSANVNQMQNQALQGNPRVQNFQPNSGSNYANCKTYMDFQVPRVDGVTGQGPYNPGMPGNVATGLWNARQHANRGNIPADWLYSGLGSNVFQQPGNGVQTVVPMNTTGSPLNNGTNGRKTGRQAFQ